jgi:signal transduction histidine kinase
MVTGTRRGSALPGATPGRPGRGPFARWPRSADAALAVGTFLLEVIGILGRAVAESNEFSLSMLGDIPVATYLLLAASSAALLWRRTRPLVVLSITLAAGLAWDLIRLADGPSLAILVSLYGVGRYITDNRTSLLTVGAAMVVVVADDLIEGEAPSVVGVSLGLVFLAWYVGRRVESRRRYLALIEERTEYLERERTAEARRAVAEERTRIARELHDLVAHRVSMITVQAGAAQTVAPSDPDRAIRSMAAVEQAGREALEELRQVLGVLRGDEESGTLAPMHGLADISDLVEETQRAGVHVSLSTDGTPDALPTRLDLASYRIIQEALTNVVKHGGPNPEAEVRISADGTTLTIEVTDRGSGMTTLPGSGQGLVGMRERATLLGGSFEAGPRPDGGFRVIARLPLLEEPS